MSRLATQAHLVGILHRDRRGALLPAVGRRGRVGKITGALSRQVLRWARWNGAGSGEGWRWCGFAARASSAVRPDRLAAPGPRCPRPDHGDQDLVNEVRGWHSSPVRAGHPAGLPGVRRCCGRAIDGLSKPDDQLTRDWAWSTTAGLEGVYRPTAGWYFLFARRVVVASLAWRGARRHRASSGAGRPCWPTSPGMRGAVAVRPTGLKLVPYREPRRGRAPGGRAPPGPGWRHGPGRPGKDAQGPCSRTAPPPARHARRRATPADFTRCLAQRMIESPGLHGTVEDLVEVGCGRQKLGSHSSARPAWTKSPGRRHQESVTDPQTGKKIIPAASTREAVPRRRAPGCRVKAAGWRSSSTGRVVNAATYAGVRKKINEGSWLFAFGGTKPRRGDVEARTGAAFARRSAGWKRRRAEETGGRRSTAPMPRSGRLGLPRLIPRRTAPPQGWSPRGPASCPSFRYTEGDAPPYMPRLRAPGSRPTEPSAAGAAPLPSSRRPSP